MYSKPFLRRNDLVLEQDTVLHAWWGETTHTRRGPFPSGKAAFASPFWGRIVRFLMWEEPAASYQCQLPTHGFRKYRI